MDAKPHRPLRALLPPQGGNENLNIGLLPSQKPAGSLKTMASTGGLKLAAKRTAFADLSNTLRGTIDAGTKALAAQNSASFDKENASQGGFLIPAQRPRHSSILPAAKDSHPENALPVKSTYARLSGDSHVQLPVVKPNPPKQVSAVYHDHAPQPSDQKLRPSISNIIDRPATLVQAEHRSPRHYKSQPYLKPQQPLLRRTQSRLLSTEQKPDHLLALVDDDITEAPYVDAVEQHQPEILEEIGEDELLQFFRGELPDAAELALLAEPEADNMMAKDGPVSTTAMSEVEEYWDEDEDFYDEQGYTTAHSYRSNGDNTTGGATTVIIPKLTAKVQKELDAAQSYVESNMTQEEVEEEAWDVSMVAEYGDEIFAYMKELETKMLPNPHYMDIQTEIQWSMRSVLMEWLVQVHTRFTLLPETLFLTVNYIDRFLSCKIVSVGKLQLVGATAIFIASKYEEINCPSIQEIVYMVDGGYSADEILKAERFMLSMLGFELGWPGPMSFLRRISKADDYELETRTLAKYFLEVTIMDERFVGCPPSFLAAGAHCLARFLLQKGEWTLAHTHYSGYTWTQLKHLTTMIFECCQNPRIHHAAVFEKYSDRRFKKASIYVEDEIRKGFTLPYLHHSQPVITVPVSTLLDDNNSSLALPAPEMGMLIPIES